MNIRSARVTPEIRLTALVLSVFGLLAVGFTASSLAALWSAFALALGVGAALRLARADVFSDTLVEEVAVAAVVLAAGTLSAVFAPDLFAFFVWTTVARLGVFWVSVTGVPAALAAYV
jgi:hypothetical protein